MRSYFDSEKVKKTITHVLETIKTETDPLLLEQYHTIFKKEVSLFRRSEAAAYLLMMYDQGRNFRQKQYRNSAARSGELPLYPARPQQSIPAEQRYPLADEESRRLFFSVGRNRRVYPREILGLINAKTVIAKEDIGAIRILDNYSFVQVRDTVAEKIIEALNGQIFRGRKLAVNYAKSRKDQNDEDDSGEISIAPGVFQEVIPGIGPIGPITIRPEDENDVYSDQGKNDSDEEDI